MANFTVYLLKIANLRTVDRRLRYPGKLRRRPVGAHLHLGRAPCVVDCMWDHLHSRTIPRARRSTRVCPRPPCPYRLVHVSALALPALQFAPLVERMAALAAAHNRPISVYRFPRRALTLCPQLCMGIQPDACFPARSADALPATLYGHFTKAIYRNRPI